MTTIVRDNERSHAIDLISLINQSTMQYDLQIKKAGGERTISTGRSNTMFPDVVLYGDLQRTKILQGWELKLPDTLITDETFIKDSQRKANALGLNSCFIWNFTSGVLYVKDEHGVFVVKKQWNNTNHISTRTDVETYRDDWEPLIKEIILEINQFFLTGEITGSTLGEIISDSVVATIITRNKGIVADFLAHNVIRDTIMGAFINVWWDELGNEFAKDEPNKFNAYAKTIILNWTNRIIFAHLIKRYHNAANKISEINIETTPNQANDIFQEITNACDFFNIFSSLDYNACLPENTWSELIELNDFLEENGISEIEQSSLQTILERSVSTTKRELAGQYTTPTKLAEILAKITILDRSGDCIDPCCGTGSIPKAILNYKKEFLNAEAAVSTTWASDKYGYPLQVANISLTSPDSINLPNRIFKHNVLSLKSGTFIGIVNPVNGELMDLEIPTFSSITSNLPFIPFEIINDDDLAIINNIKNEVQENTNCLLSNKSDLYCFIIFALHKLVVPNGRIGLITSNSWLGTSWGKVFLTALTQYYNVNQVHISGTGRWFHNAQVVTVLLILTKKASISSNLGNESINFCVWNKDLQEIKDDESLMNTIVNSSLLNRSLNPDVISLNKYDYEQIGNLLALNLSLNSLFHNVSWILSIKDKLIPLNKVFSVFRGERRGWDEMFYPEQNHNIESTFIKKVLKNARGVTTLCAQADNDAFCCSKSLSDLREQNMTGALNWIRKFESGVNGVGKPLIEVLSRRNMYWYEMRDDSTADICTMMNPDQRLFFARFDEPTFINQRLIGLRVRPEYSDVALNHALLNSILGMFYIEAVGFGRGLGVLDINKDSINSAFMLNPNLVSIENRMNILNKFQLLLNRNVTSTENELDESDRKSFDLAVLSSFGIEDYYSLIKNSLVSMQRTRLSARE